MANGTNNINVNMTFTANTQQAKQQMRDLTTSMQQLNQHLNKEISIKGLTEELKEGYQAAKFLESSLVRATNVQTGKLDLTKFNASLKSSGKSLSDYAATLAGMGQVGTQAFLSISQSIINAEVPLRKTNLLVDKLWSTLQNTARWQLSANLVQGFAGAVSTAYRYTQDLNKSLNDIRIVTGYGVDKMAEFAVQANKAAKALSTTTNEYSKASLIYFQQGLTDAEVQARTDVTVKLANVTRQGAEQVSDQMTAVWNNFYDGSKSLEYYADVLTNLGAATASSSDEIAQGLEKFSAVAKTVGLSYEYATAALATVTAETRQSADVVGTAFKTLFARIQDVELGETLDDGTTLGKYSAALQAVGIDIKTASGGLKDMDAILAEMGAKWDTLSRAQQAALAQTVAGTRQYTQLVALMDNWDKFQTNLTTANTSTGVLNEQAEIYAESWEAARKRVEASAETIYDTLLNDEFFIDLANMFADLLDGIKSVIDSLGGVPGILGVIGVLIPKLFGDKILFSVKNTFDQISQHSKKAREEAQQLKKDAAKSASDITLGWDSSADEAKSSAMSHRYKILSQIYNLERELTPLEQQQLELIMDSVDMWDQMAIAASEAYDAADDQVIALNKDIDNLKEKLESLNSSTYDAELSKQQIIDKYSNPSGKNQRALGEKDINKLTNKYDIFNGDSKIAATNSLKFQKELMSRYRLSEKDAKDLVVALRTLNQTQGQTATTTEALTEAEKKQAEASSNLEKAEEKRNEAAKKAESASKNGVKQAKNMSSSFQDTGISIMNLVSALSSVTMMISSFSSVVDIWNDETLSGWDKFSKIMMSLGFILPNVVSLFSSFEKALNINTITKLANAAATVAQAKEEKNATQNRIESIKSLINQTKNNAKKFFDKEQWRTQFNNNAWNALGEDQKNQYLDELLNNSKDYELITSGKNKGMYRDLNSPVSVGGRTEYKNITLDEARQNFVKEAKVLAGKDSISNLQTLGKTVGITTLKFAALAVVLYGAFKLFEYGNKLYNKDKIASQEAAAAAAALTKRYDEQAQKYNNLKSSIESYQDQLQGLNDLTKGTVEYTEAISDANDKSLELINTYSELAGQYKVSTEGLIVFNDGVLENLQLTQLQNKAALRSEQMYASQRQRETEIQANKTELLRKNIKTGADGKVDDGEFGTILQSTGAGVGAGVLTATGIAIGTAVAGATAAGTKIGAAIGSAIVPGLGTAIGAGIGLAVGAVTGAVIASIDNEATEEENKAYDALAKRYEEIGNGALAEDEIRKTLEQNGIINEDLVKQLSENSEALEQQLQAILANTAAIEAENKIRAQEFAAAENKNFVNLDTTTQEAISNSLANLTTNKIEEKDKSYYRNQGITFGHTKEGEELFNEWAKKQGLKDPKYTNFGENTITYNFYNEETKKTEERELHYDELEAFRKQKEASTLMSQQIENAYNAFANTQGTTGARAVASFVANNNLQNMRASEIEELKKLYNEADWSSAKTFVQTEELYKLEDELIETLSQAAKAQGITSIELAQDFWKALLDYDAEAAIEAYTETATKERASIIESAATKLEVDKKALENYAEATLKASEALSEASDEWERQDKITASTRIAVINAQITEGIDVLAEALEDGEDALKEWNDLSLDTWEAVAKIQTAIESMFGIKVSGQYVKNNLKELQELAKGSTESLEELRKEAAKDFLLNLDIDENTSRTLAQQLESFLNSLSPEQKALGVQVTLEDSQFVNGINDLLNTGKLTVEQVQGLFNSVGFDPNIQYRTDKIKNVTEYSVYDEQAKTTNRYTATTWTTVSVPYIPNGSTAKKETYYDDQGNIIKASSEEEAKATGKLSRIQGYMQATTTKNDQSLTSLGDSSIIKAGLNENRVKAAANAKDKKKLSEEIERYHEIDKTIERLQRDYNKLSEAKERAFGQKHLDYLDQEIEKTKELKAAAEARLAEAKAYFESDRATMISKYGMSTDAFGNITNYDEMIKKNVAAYNANPEDQEDAYEQFKADLEQYESTLDEMRSTEDEIQSYLYQLMDQELEKINYKVELEIGLADDDLSLIEFQLENFGDTAADTAKKFKLLGDQMAATQRQAEAMASGIGQILGTSGLDLDKLLMADPEQIAAMVEGKNLTEEQISSLRDYVGQLYNSVNAMKEMREEISENLITAFEDMNKEMDKSLSNMEHMNSLIDSFRNIIDLAGRDTLGISDELIEKMAKTQLSVSQDTIRTAKAQLEQNTKALADAQEKLDEARKGTDEAAIKEWEETVDELTGTVQDNQNALLESLSAGLEAATKIFEEEMNNIMDTFEESMSGIYGSFAALQEAFDRQTEINDRYLDDYQKIYELSKLNRDLTASMDDTDSFRGKQRLRDLQEEINELQASNTQMTQYEVDELRARYDLRVAEIALEEAQNAKSQVRMQRDSNGNWGYVYTADENAVDSARQDYEDKLYAYQTLLQENIDELQARLVAIPQEYAEAVRAIYEDQTLNDEERAARIAEIQDYYQGMYAHVVEQLRKTTADSKTLYDEDWTNYSNLTGYKISLDKDWVDSFKETVVSQTTGLDTLDQAQQVFEVNSKVMLSNLIIAYQDYRTEVKKTLDQGIDDIETFFGDDATEGTLAYYLGQMKQKSGEAADKAEEMGKKNAEAFKTAVEAADSWLDDYSEKINQWNKKTESIATAVSGVIDAYSELRVELGKVEESYKNVANAKATYNNVKDYKDTSDYSEGISFNAYTKALKYKGNIGYTASGETSQFSNIDQSTIKASTEFTKQINDTGLGKITFTNANGKTQTAYIDEQTAKTLGLYTKVYSGKTLTEENPSLPEGTFEVTTDNGGGKLQRYYAWVTSSGSGRNVKYSTEIRKDWADGLSKGIYVWEEYSENPNYGFLKYYGTDSYVTGGSTIGVERKGDLFEKAEILKRLSYTDSTFKGKSFDTGGYTGSWDASGRLAMLHQKELVLNASDTVNFLSAVDILRDITKVIDLQALSQSNLMSALTSASVGTNAQILEQEVTIHAEFPNATERTEIEAAFDSLLNRASQFANRKNK